MGYTLFLPAVCLAIGWTALSYSKAYINLLTTEIYCIYARVNRCMYVSSSFNLFPECTGQQLCRRPVFQGGVHVFRYTTYRLPPHVLGLSLRNMLTTVALLFMSNLFPRNRSLFGSRGTVAGGCARSGLTYNSGQQKQVNRRTIFVINRQKTKNEKATPPLSPFISIPIILEASHSVPRRTPFGQGLQ